VKLVTLGKLQIENLEFGREKLLVLLAYLALEGSKSRRFLANLFWSDSTNPMNNLAVALVKLRRINALEADSDRVWTNIECDVVEIKTALRSGQWQHGIDAYTGAFVTTMPMDDIGSEIENWIYTERENIAHEIRQAHLILAEKQASAGNFLEAARIAEQARQVLGAPPLEPEAFPRLYRLLLAGEHPAADHLSREARELGISLSESVQSARGRLRQGLIGRSRELQSLLSLELGQWAWVQGGNGMGKTTLMQEIQQQGDWLYLPARSGLPYATLEPVLESLHDGLESLLRQLVNQQEHLLLDDWDQMDIESQQVLLRLRNLRPNIKIIVTSTSEPPFMPDRMLELESLTASELDGFPGAFEATGGVPSLVGAWLRDEPLETALGVRMLGLHESAQQVHQSLALLESPDLSLVRQALGLDSVAMAQAIGNLLSAGLIDLNGEVFGRETVLKYLAERPMLEAQLSLALARLLKPQLALPLYRKARTLLEESDVPQLRAAHVKWALELIQRGFPKRAAQELLDAPRDSEVDLLRAKALERAGLYKESLEAARDLPDTPEHMALRAVLHHWLGNPSEAKTCAERALAGGIEARAEAHNTLGYIFHAQGDYQAAVAAFRKAAALWLGLGDENRRLSTLVNLAAARARLGEDAEAMYRDVLEVANGNLQVEAQVQINLGSGYYQKNDLEQALEHYRQAETIAIKSGNSRQIALAQNNIGSMLHLQNNLNEAKVFYNKAISSARMAGEILVLAMAMANLAEAEGDTDAWEEAISILENAGYQQQAQEHREDLQAFRAKLL
jgi:tetratricopeptide (TPR) repeat protein